MSGGCVPSVLLLVASAAAWGALFWARLPAGYPKATFLCAFVGAVATTGFVILVYRTFAMWGRWRATERALRGLPQAEGARGSALGELHPIEASLAAPFSGTPALAYEYQVSRAAWEEDVRGQGGEGHGARLRKVVAYAGRAIAPCEVRTESGPVRIGTRPRFDVATDVPLGPEARERARRFLADTSFTRTDGDDVPEGYGRDDDAPSQAADLARADWIVRGAPPDLEGCELSESVVRPGERVLAVGQYSPSARGLFRDAEGKAGSLSIERPASADGTRRPAGCAALLPVLLLLVQVVLVFLAVSPAGQELFRSIADTQPTPTWRRR